MERREFLKYGLRVGATALLGSEAAGLQVEPDAKPLQEFGYGDVELAPGRMRTQFEETQAVLLSLDEDALLRPWRLRAGLPAPGGPLGGWYDEVPLVKTPSGGQGFAPGHAFGQWISALARGYAVKGDPATQAKLRRILELYGPAISGKFYTNFRFPSYNYDKIVIGLIDAHQFASVDNAFSLLDRTTDAAGPHLPPTALDRDAPQIAWRKATGQNTTGDYGWDEPYTLPENLYLAAQRGAGERYRTMAPKYLLNQAYFDPLSENKNVLRNHHAYSFCNALSSAMQAYLVDGSEKHLRAAVNAHEMIVTTQSYATGGWGPDESFREPNTGALHASLTNTKHSFETPCGSYGHFKLTRYLLRVTRDGKYGDSMERVLYNTVLGAKTLEKDGHAFYYSDYSNSATKFYFDDKWPCCSGTLPQVAADYHILGYFHDGDGVYVNLYIPSTLKWAAKSGARIALTQSTAYPLDGRIEMVMKASKAAEFALRLRIPAWALDPDIDCHVCTASIRVNGQVVNAPVAKGFATLRRKWKDGDRVELNLQLPMRLEAIDAQHPDTVALMRGPLVLFALTDDAPRATREQLLAAQPMKGQAVWMAATDAGPLLLTPFTDIHEERYRTYMTVTSGA
jgi:uncharacterized protein